MVGFKLTQQELKDVVFNHRMLPYAFSHFFDTHCAKSITNWSIVSILTTVSEKYQSRCRFQQAIQSFVI